MASTKKSKEEHREKKKKNNNGNKTPSKNKTPTKLKQEKTKKNKENNNKKNKKTANGTFSQVLIDPSSSCDPQEVQEIQEHELSRKFKKNQSPKSENIKNGKKRKEKERDDYKAAENGEDGFMCRIPMARIKRIMKSDEPDLSLGQDVVFLVNKATEKFLEQFCEEAYECSVRDRKKSLGYKHLSSVVTNQLRYDFLSDFVPEKLKAEDALAQRKVSETGQG